MIWRSLFTARTVTGCNTLAQDYEVVVLVGAGIGESDCSTLATVWWIVQSGADGSAYTSRGTP